MGEGEKRLVDEGLGDGNLPETKKTSKNCSLMAERLLYLFWLFVIYGLRYE